MLGWRWSHSCSIVGEQMPSTEAAAQLGLGLPPSSHLNDDWLSQGITSSSWGTWRIAQCIRKTPNLLFHAFSCFFVLFSKKAEKAEKSPVLYFLSAFWGGQKSKLSSKSTGTQKVQKSTDCGCWDKNPWCSIDHRPTQHILVEDGVCDIMHSKNPKPKFSQSRP